MLSPAAYLKEYVGKLDATLALIPAQTLQAAVDLLVETMHTGRRIYVCGNGGSAAISDHLCCDWTKGTRVIGQPVLKTHSLVANSALLTALANDSSFEDVFSSQLELFAEAGDVLVAISSSGSSANIIKAVHTAQKLGMKVLGLSGFSGGPLAKTADVSLHAPFENYGLVEDCHQVLMHVLSQFLVRQIESPLNSPLNTKR